MMLQALTMICLLDQTSPKPLSRWYRNKQPFEFSAEDLSITYHDTQFIAWGGTAGDNWYNYQMYATSINQTEGPWRVVLSLFDGGLWIYGGRPATIGVTVYFFYQGKTQQVGSFDASTVFVTKEINYGAIASPPRDNGYGVGYLTTNGKDLLFVFGGLSLKTVYYYNVSEEQGRWKAGGQTNQPHSQVSAEYLNAYDTLVIFGCGDACNPAAMPPHNISAIEYISLKDILSGNGTFTVSPATFGEYPYVYGFETALVGDGYVYIIGGWNFTRPFNDVYLYSFKNQTAEKVEPNYPQKGYNMASVVVDGSMHLFGGDDGEDTQIWWYYSNKIQM
eukprot:354079_1